MMRVDLATGDNLNASAWNRGRRLLHTRLQVRSRRCQLDRDLAAGICVLESAALELRARQLGRLRTRSQLASGLRRVVRDARNPRLSLSGAVPPARPAVLPWAEGLLGVADRLEQPGAIGVRGLARIALLLSDGTGPLYAPSVNDALGDAIWAIGDGLGLCQLRHSSHAGHTGHAVQSQRQSPPLCPVCGALARQPGASEQRD